VEIVVFADFQCPACRMLARDLKAIRAEFPRYVAVRYRHAPLPIHPFAVEAAHAASAPPPRAASRSSTTRCSWTSR